MKGRGEWGDKAKGSTTFCKSLKELVKEGSGEGVGALFKGEWEASGGFKQRSKRTRLAQLGPRGTQGPKAPPSSPAPLCLCVVTSTSSLIVVSFLSKHWKKINWALFVPRTGYSTTFIGNL